MSGVAKTSTATHRSPPEGLEGRGGKIPLTARRGRPS